MANRPKDPRRWRLRLEDWPAEDRQAWDAATKVGGLLEDSGLAAHWRPNTRRAVTGAYGHYLMFLSRNGWLDPNATPGERVTLERLRAYRDELSKMVVPVTLAGRFTNLREALRVMAPGVEFPYLNRAQRQLVKRARPVRDKKRRVVPSQRLFELGLQLIAQAEAGTFAREVWRAARYRDGVIILLLAFRAIRRGNLTAMRLDQNLRKVEGIYVLSFDAEQMKNGRSYEAKLAPELTPHLDRYLEYYRPILLGQCTNDFVWITWLGQRLAPDSLYEKICEHTMKGLGHAINPHLFRDCAITSIANEAPEQVLIGMAVLHHTDPSISLSAYNQAEEADAIGRYQGMIQRRRRTAVKVARTRELASKRRR